MCLEFRRVLFRSIGRAPSELQSHSEISYAVFCLKKKKISVSLDSTSIVKISFSCPVSSSSTAIVVSFFFLMIRRPPRSTLILTLFPTRRSSDLNAGVLPPAPVADVDTDQVVLAGNTGRSEEHTSELQSHSEISYAVFCLKKK